MRGRGHLILHNPLYDADKEEEEGEEKALEIGDGLRPFFFP